MSRKIQSKYLFITRLFSGMFESIISGEWKPTGIPAFVKLIETLDKNHDITWVIICRSKAESDVVSNSRREITFLNNVRVYLLPYKSIFNLCKVDGYITSFLAIRFISKLIRANKSFIVYSDRSNILVAAYLRKFLKMPVVLRILGLYPDQKLLASQLVSKFLDPLTYLSYRTSFSAVICTQDGSGVEFYLDKLIKRSVPREVLINGVDMGGNIASQKTQKDYLSFLFVGRITEKKGISDLMPAFLKLHKRGASFKLFIVGKGNRLAWMEDFIKKHMLSDKVILLGSLGREELRRCYQTIDVYISLNRLGNLSNTVLEAMSENMCVMTLSRKKDDYTDWATEKLVPNDVVIRINRDNVAENLVYEIENLLKNPELVDLYRQKMSDFSGKFLNSWDQRIERENTFLNRVIQHD